MKNKDILEEEIFEKIIDKYKKKMESNEFILKKSLQKYLFDSQNPLFSRDIIKEGVSFVIKRPLCYIEIINNINKNDNINKGINYNNNNKININNDNNKVNTNNDNNESSEDNDNNENNDNNKVKINI